jgi:hypothetical protein
MNPFYLGFVASLFIALPCVWYGQLQVNPSAQLLLWPEHVTEHAEQ